MKLAVIGCGNMANAIIGGILKKGILAPEDITAADHFEGALERARAAHGIKTVSDNKEAVRGADVILLAVKPGVFASVAEDLKGCIGAEQLVISIMAGRTLKDIAGGLGEGLKIVRVMPNTPALVGAGMSAYTPGEGVGEEDLAVVRTILTSFGEAEQVPESLMPVVTSLSGSSPAYVFMMIEAMADAAVADGMPRDKAMHFAAMTVMGSASLALSDGRHPGALKDMVCSPGGTTIEGVISLEKNGFRAAVMEAVRAATAKSKIL